MVLLRVPKQVAEKARAFACGVYKNVPRALIPNAGEDAVRFIWDNFCDPTSNPQEPPLPGLPPPPTPEIKGGQCVDEYQVDITIKQTSGNVTAVTVFCRGPIRGFKWRWDGTFNNIDLQAYTRTGAYAPQDHYVFGARPNAYPGMYPVVTKITRRNNQPDNCGDSPKQYPLPPGPPPNTIFTSPPTPIVLNDNDTINVTFNLIPPTVVSPSLKLPPIVVRVDSPTLKLPISFEFNGDINFGSPDSVEIDLGDVENTINNINNNTNRLPDFFKDFDFVFNPPAFPDSPDVDEVEIPPSEEGEKDAEGLLGVVVTLTKMPDKAQFGSPTCYFAGWLTFYNQGGYEPRYQINFETAYFPAPLGCTGYAYTFTNGAEGAIREYRKIVQG